MVKVSIIVPIYKVEAYLPRCLDSLLGQTMRDIEIICVNDGSPDGCAKILEAYAVKDSRIRIVNRENGGLSAARNSGMAIATAPYMMFCDSDDAFEPQMCERMFNAVVSFKADVAVCGTRLFRENPDFVSNVTDGYFKLPGMPGVHTIDDETCLRLNVCACNKIFNRELVRKYNIVFPVGLKHEDIAFFWQYMFVAKRIVYVEDLLYCYFLRNDSIMGEENINRSSVLHSLKSFRYAVDFARRNGLLASYSRLILEEYVALFSYSFKNCLEVDRNLLYDEAIDFLSGFDYRSMDLPAAAVAVLNGIRDRRFPNLRIRRLKLFGMTIVKESCKLNGYSLRVLGIPLIRRRWQWTDRR